VDPYIPDWSPLKRLAPTREKIKKYIIDKTRSGVTKMLGVGLLITWLPELAEAVGIEAALHFLPYLVEAAAEEYGKEQVEKYVKEKLKKRLQDRSNERNRTEEERFMKKMLAVIIAGGLDPNGPHHPLYFLVDPHTRTWKSRKVGGGFAVQPGHTLSHKAYGFAFALEDAISNQRLRGDMTETPGGFAFSTAIKIDGVYIDWGTARWYELRKLLPEGTCSKAPFSVGWIDFSF
jgi:hypothetical protein